MFAAVFRGGVREGYYYFQRVVWLVEDLWHEYEESLLVVGVRLWCV